MKKNRNLITAVIVVALGMFLYFGFFGNKTNYKNEIAKQDLKLKCQEVYSELHHGLESIRYGQKIQSSDSVIWSPKTETCLAYYNVPQENYNNFLFEVWDYTNDDLILSYTSNLSNECVQNDVTTSMQNFIYKYNKKLEGSGCNLLLMSDNIDLLLNFEKAMAELGFKK